MSDKTYFSFIEQTLHYFDRPHEREITEPLESPAALRQPGAQLIRVVAS